MRPCAPRSRWRAPRGPSTSGPPRRSRSPRPSPSRARRPPSRSGSELRLGWDNSIDGRTAGVTAALFKRPGWWRALTYTILAGAFGLALVVVLLKVSGLPAVQTQPTGSPQVIVPAITAPLGFLVAIGCFDYWLRWAVGASTSPAERDRESHGGYT